MTVDFNGPFLRGTGRHMNGELNPMKMIRRNFIKSSLAAGAAVVVPDLLAELAVTADAESQTDPLQREIPPREAAKSVTPVDYVDPFVGSQGSRWFVFTPAAVPFGLVKLAPMTYGFNGYRVRPCA